MVLSNQSRRVCIFRPVLDICPDWKRRGIGLRDPGPWHVSGHGTASALSNEYAAGNGVAITVKCHTG